MLCSSSPTSLPPLPEERVPGSMSADSVTCVYMYNISISLYMYICIYV